MKKEENFQAIKWLRKYDEVMEKINVAKENGQKSLRIGPGLLEPKVAEMIAEDGHQVNIVLGEDGEYNEIIISHDEEECDGDVIILSKTSQDMADHEKAEALKNFVFVSERFNTGNKMSDEECQELVKEFIEFLDKNS